MQTIKLSIEKGRWTINQKPLNLCSKEKTDIFVSFFRMKKIKMPVDQKKRSSFKERALQIKQLYNYKFANLHDDNLENYPNIETLTFERKTT